MDSNAAERAAAEVRARLARAQIPGKQLGNHLGLSTFAISRRLRGTTPFSITELHATARFLGVEVVDLLPKEHAAQDPGRARSEQARPVPSQQRSRPPRHPWQDSVDGSPDRSIS